MSSSVFLKYVKSSDMYENIKRGPMKSESDYRTERVFFRVTKEEKETIQIMARMKHQTTADFIRSLIFIKYFDEFINVLR